MSITRQTIKRLEKTLEKEKLGIPLSSLITDEQVKRIMERDAERKKTFKKYEYNQTDN